MTTYPSTAPFIRMIITAMKLIVIPTTSYEQLSWDRTAIWREVLYFLIGVRSQKEMKKMYSRQSTAKINFVHRDPLSVLRYFSLKKLNSISGLTFPMPHLSFGLYLDS